MEKEGKSLQRKNTAGEGALEVINDSIKERKTELARIDAQIKARKNAEDIVIKAEEVCKL